MQHEEFLGKVQRRARLRSLTQAETVTAATLHTLAERLAGGAAGNIGSQLPRETAQYMEDVEFSEPFSLDEFFARVGRREGVAVADAVHHARSVMAVLSDAVSTGALQHVRAQLSDEWDPLFDSGSEGEMRRASRNGGPRDRARPAARDTGASRGDGGEG